MKISFSGLRINAEGPAAWIIIGLVIFSLVFSFYRNFQLQKKYEQSLIQYQKDLTDWEVKYKK